MEEETCRQETVDRVKKPVSMKTHPEPNSIPLVISTK